MAIQAIRNADVHKITSGQVIIDLRSAIKELLENSLDAQADKIDIVFKNYGIEAIECSDNGTGIPEEDLESVGMKHRTSKLTTFEGLSKVLSFGFRGEAIASLCQMGNVTITTTTNGPKAYKMVFDHTGMRTKTICSRNTGTTVSVTDLFDTLPVRKKDFVKNHKRQFSRSIELLQSYAIVQTNVKISVSNVLPSGRKSLLLSTTGKSDIPRNLLSIFGSNANKGMTSVDLDLDLSNIKLRYIVPESQREGVNHSPEFEVHVKGHISMATFGCGRASKDRQYIYVNRRAVDHQKLFKTINDTYQSFNHIQYPAFVLDFLIDPAFLDLNVTPDKRTVCIHYEEYVLDALKEALQVFFQTEGFVVPASQSSANAAVGSKRLKLESETYNLTQPANVADSDIHKNLHKATPIVKDEYSRYSEDSKSLKTPAGVTEQYNDSEIKESDYSVANAKMKEEHASKNYDYQSEVDKKYSERTSSRDGSPLASQSGNKPDQFVLSNGSNAEEVNNNEAPLFLHSEPDDSPAEGETFSVNGSSEVKNNNSSATSDSLIENSAKKFTLDNFLHKKDKEYEIEPSPVEIDNVVVEIGNVVTTLPASQDRHNNLIIGSRTKPTETLTEDPSEDSCDHSCEHSHNHSSYESSESEDEFERVGDTVFKNTKQNDSDLEEIQRVKRAETSLSLHDINNLVTQFHASMNLEIEKSQKVISSIELDKAIKHERLVNELASIDDKKKAEDLLTLTVSKEDFDSMNVVGQFNLGFIIVTRRKGSAFDLFILDQHASDEKFNFEMLQKDTVFKSQSLLVPKTLELSVIDELLVMEYQDVFTKNGFKLRIDEDEEPGRRVKLVSFPVSKSTMFTEYDFHEIIQLIREHDGHNMSNIRCSKMQAMFAMRACRKSIMIGKPLSQRTMKKVVTNLGELDKPWNCPHGRPTLRHLMELSDWDSFYDDYMI